MGPPPACLFFYNRKCYLTYFFFHAGRGNHSAQVVLCVKLRKRGKGSVGEGEEGKRAKMTPDAGGKSVSEKSQAAHTCRNPSRNQKVNRQNFSSMK
jgi:hypothetical protein